MKLFPAIDVRGGKVVRLTQGDYDRTTVYHDDPLCKAAEFEGAGAKYLHLVDLDGAKDATLANFDAICRAASGCRMFSEVGGGIRSEDRIEAYLSRGVGRVILGTIAYEDYGFCCRMAKRYGDAIAVGVDARDGKVAINGWKQVTETDSLEFCNRMRDAGVGTVIYTDIACDGMLGGTNLEVYRKLVTIDGLRIVASGGVGSLDDLVRLKEIGVDGVIVGKALYTGAVSLRDALRVAEEA